MCLKTQQDKLSFYLFWSLVVCDSLSFKQKP